MILCDIFFLFGSQTVGLKIEFLKLRIIIEEVALLTIIYGSFDKYLVSLGFGMISTGYISVEFYVSMEFKGNCIYCCIVLRNQSFAQRSDACHTRLYQGRT
jgi:hypothetical protein